ncbi:uncharacterized protein Dmoj_GI14394 [Drosophila mojavensis]|uniref:Uncharacterized protein n=1 Tax=Drosophila mojavensis TaxID=7230 RepID=B4L8E4_DROMO|nr:uncharacterized protein Dmoj_GI14394 [Drosophila mojavensis]
MLMKVEFTTIYVEIPESRGAPPYVEEPQSLPPPPAISGPEERAAPQSESEEEEMREVQSPEEERRQWEAESSEDRSPSRGQDSRREHSPFVALLDSVTAAWDEGRRSPSLWTRRGERRKARAVPFESECSDEENESSPPLRRRCRRSPSESPARKVPRVDLAEVAAKLRQTGGNRNTTPFEPDQRSSWERQPRTGPVPSIHHSTIDLSVALEDTIMVLKGSFTTIYVPAPGVQRTPPHVEEPASTPTSPTPSQVEGRSISTDEELECWASPIPWAADEREEESYAEEVPDQLPPREIGGGRERCLSAPNPASRVASRAEAGEPEKLWTRRGERREDAEPMPTSRRRLEDGRGDNRRRNSARVAFRYVPGAVENRRGLAQPVYRPERTSRQSSAGRRDRGARSPNADGASSSGRADRRRRPASDAEPRPKWRKLDDPRLAGSSHRRELDDVLDGWQADEASQSRAEDSTGQEGFVSIPRDWTVRPEGTVLAEEVVELHTGSTESQDEEDDSDGTDEDTYDDNCIELEGEESD